MTNYINLLYAMYFSKKLSCMYSKRNTEILYDMYREKICSILCTSRKNKAVCTQNEIPLLPLLMHMQWTPTETHIFPLSSRFENDICLCPVGSQQHTIPQLRIIPRHIYHRRVTSHS